MSSFQREEDRSENSIRLPVPDDSVDLMTHVVKQISFSENKYAPGSEIYSSSHEHPLKLSGDICNSSSDGEICEVCRRPIATAGSRLCCLDCKLFIHKYCTELPNQIQHPFHNDHPLILLQKATNEFADLFLCNACQASSNGFAYHCASCDFYLDVFCSLLTDSVVHEGHQHPLVLNQEPGNLNCNACGKSCSGVMYGCDSCGFNLDLLCITFPLSFIRPRYDSHAVKLTYFPTQSNSDLAHCEICKENLNKENCWFYCCTDCNNAFHPGCIISNVDEYQLIKFGVSFDFQGHPHPLTMVRKTQKMPHCCNCALPYEGISFQCQADYSPKCRFQLEGKEFKFNLDGFCAQLCNLVEYESQ